MTGYLIGYARNLGIPSLAEQVEVLKRHNCWNIWQETRPTRWRRPELENALIDLRPGDVLVVANLGCVLMFSGCRETLERVQDARAHFQSIEPPYDSRAPNGHLVMAALMLHADMKRALRSQLILAGLARGRPGGRRPVLSDDKLATARELIASGQHSMAAIAKHLGVARSSLYNANLKATPENKRPPGEGRP